MRIKSVRVNGIENPIGFQFPEVSVSWNVTDTESKKQTNAVIEISDEKDFRNIVAKKERADLSQSGEVIDITLKPRTRYHLRITVTGDAGDTAVSDDSYFETGKMNEEWKAEWIAARKDEFVNEKIMHPVLAKKFTVEKEVEKARLYICGVGLFEAYLNGEKISDELLTPYVNNYDVDVQAITFPIETLVEGENTLEIILGKGWYMGVFGLEIQANNYGDRMAAIAELYVDYTDGETEHICTDDSWTYHGSDIEDSGIYDGEIYNRMLWDGKENAEKSVEVIHDPEADQGTKNLVKAHIADRISIPVKVKEEIAVKEMIQSPAGETILDMGQNFAGYLEFTADLPKGTEVVFDFGEILQEGNFYNGNYRDAKSKFVYTSNGIKEVVRPHFTFYGFRYARVTGWTGELKAEDFIGKVVYSDLTRTGYIETADSKINRLYENTLWGLKSNFLDMPTDCPQRSERLGWTGDAQVFAPTASYHMDTRAFFHKFIKDLKDEQKMLNGGMPNFIPNMGHTGKAGSIWGDIATLLPNTLYRYYGDICEMRNCYPMMKGWVDFIDGMDEKRGRTYLFDTMDTFGDWLALDGATPTSFKGSTDDCYLSTIYYYRSTQVVKEMAERLGMAEDVAYYGALEAKIKKAIFKEYFTQSGRLAIDTQAAYVTALKFGVYIDRNRIVAQFKERLQKDLYQIKCGFAGAPLLCTVLAEAGLYELAYDFLLKEEFPGWLYAVNMGATTVWERWNSVGEDGTISDTGMNSLNHYAYGSVMEFVYGYVVGIRAVEPGFKKAAIAPHPDVRIPYVNGRYDSVNGTYVCNWKIEDDGKFNVHIEIPFNCSAEVTLPEYDKGTMALESGSYDFVYEPGKDFRKSYSKETTLARIAKDERAIELLGKYTPVLAGIAMSGDPEMGSNSLEQMKGKSFLPFSQEELQKAIDEISELVVTVCMRRNR